MTDFPTHMSNAEDTEPLCRAGAIGPRTNVWMFVTCTDCKAITPAQKTAGIRGSVVDWGGGQFTVSIDSNEPSYPQGFGTWLPDEGSGIVTDWPADGNDDAKVDHVANLTAASVNLVGEMWNEGVYDVRIARQLIKLADACEAVLAGRGSPSGSSWVHDLHPEDGHDARPADAESIRRVIREWWDGGSDA